MWSLQVTPLNIYKGIDIKKMTLNNTPLIDNLITSDSTNDTWHQLLIIGNGFDLECGLGSSWEEFFSKRRAILENLKFPSSEKELFKWYKTLTEAEITIWDIKLSEKHNKIWFEIEQRLLDLVSNYKNWLYRSGVEYELDDIYTSKPSDDIDPTYCRMICYIASALGYQELTDAECEKFLRSELNKLESAFSNYLLNQVHRANKSGTTGYTENAKRKLIALLSKQLPSSGKPKRSYSVLSFNYTGPFRPIATKVGSLVGFTNIHGRCKEGNEIIFGTDGTDWLEDPLIRPFTKTYRLLGLGGPENQEVIRPNTRCIKFYGHSLSKADYSYFQAIFDAVHLYSSDVSLIFFYRCFDDRDPSFHRTEMVNKVINLLSKYGGTLENRDHGKNLIHKLLLEGRLTVQEIDFNGEEG